MTKFNKIERGDIVQIAERFLWEEEAKSARDYLLQDRCLSEDVLRSFHVGFLPDDLNHKLRGRIILPLYDASGNLICINSRAIREENDGLPKYWHETYEKSLYLYGLNIAKHEMRRCRFAIVVEGQIDVLQLHKHGAKNAIAICGSTLSYTQYSMILRYCEEIVLILDNDENKAGQRATSKIASAISKFSEGVESGSFVALEYKMISLELKSAKDPDEFVKKFGFEALKYSIRNKLMELRSRNDY